MGSRSGCCPGCGLGYCFSVAWFPADSLFTQELLTGGSDLGPTWYAWGTLPVWCDGALREMCRWHWRSPTPGGWVGAARGVGRGGQGRLP